MKIQSALILLLAFLPAALGSDEIIYFADDHYKALGSPELTASVVTPVFEPGIGGILQIDLANAGRADELIPSSIQPGSEAVAASEMSEEMGVADAFYVVASLHSMESPGLIRVVSGPVRVAELPSGAVEPVNFTIDVDGSAEGSYGLVLNLSYERQADVSASDGGVFPLYLPDSMEINLTLTVLGQDISPRLVGVSSDLGPGRNGTVTAMIKNPGARADFYARLLAAPPFHTSGHPIILGSLGTGQVAAARFEVLVDPNATLQEYRLACEVGDGNRTEMLPVPVMLHSISAPVWPVLGIAFVFASIIAALRFLNRRKTRQI